MGERVSSAPMIVSASQDCLPDGCRKRLRLAAAANDCCRPQRVRARSWAFQQARSSDAAWQRAVSVLYERLHSHEGHHSLNEYPPLSSPRRSPLRDARLSRVSLIFAFSSSSPWDRTHDRPFLFFFLSFFLPFLLNGPTRRPIPTSRYGGVPHRCPMCEQRCEKRESARTQLTIESRGRCG